MEKTLDSICPMDETNAEMSYLFGRDPSILAYGQRPYPTCKTKKNLLSSYEILEESKDSSKALSDCSKQTFSVYLRLKPYPKKINLTKEELEAYQIYNSTTFITRLPIIDANTSCLKRSKSDGPISRKFTFTHIFPMDTTQLEIFDQSIRVRMDEFLAGHNCTVMSYGTTNSGKTYTLQGNPSSPGIIPRSLEFVFSNISPRVTALYKPVNNCDIIVLDTTMRAAEIELKTKLLTFGSTDKNQYIAAYKLMQKLLQEESPTRPSQMTDAQYSVWVSFAEIYNETVYDLLSNDCPKKRPSLKLSTDSRGRTYIKGLKMVCVNSGSEAYQVLMAGQYNLKVAATALNSRSSRSHCIFTIKLLKYYSENDPDSVEISTFSFCDLAGSERLKKTLNIGDRLKEAQNINTSLLVLGRCLKSIHEGQSLKQKSEPNGPFRESKLTRLFQWALCGKENITMIVNVNPVPTLFIETQNVLCFSAIAKKIVVQAKKENRQRTKSRFSVLACRESKNIDNWELADLDSVEEITREEDNLTSVDEAEYEEILLENERLQEQIVALKNSMLNRDIEIRQEMADTYTKMIKKLENDFQKRIQDMEDQKEDAIEWSVRRVEDFYKQKLDQMSSRKRKRSTNSDDSINESEHDDAHTIKELEDEVIHLNSVIGVLKEKINKLRETEKKANADKNNAMFEASILKGEIKSLREMVNVAEKKIDFDSSDKLYVEELKSQLQTKSEHIKKLKQFLNEAKEEYITITKDMQQKETELKQKEYLIIEQDEKIEDLEAQLEHADICLSEKTKDIEALEERLEIQGKYVQNTKNQMHEMTDTIAQLEQDRKTLNERILLLNKQATINVEDVSLDENIVKEEVKQETDSFVENCEIKENILQLETEKSQLKEELYNYKIEVESLKSAMLKFKNDDVQKKLEDNICNIKTSDNKTLNVITDCEDDEIKKENVSHDNCSQTSILHTNDSSCQTSFVEQTEEQSIQTSFCIADNENFEEAQNTAEADELADIVEEMKKNAELYIKDIENYKSSIESLNKKLCTITSEKIFFEDELKSIQKMNQSLETKIANYEEKLTEIQNDLVTKEKTNQSYSEELHDIQQKYEEQLSKCFTEHETKIKQLEKDLEFAIEQRELKVQCIDAYLEKIADLEKNIEKCNYEKEELQKHIDENNARIASIENEKDEEIMQLQNELKKLIQGNNDDKIMEQSLKSAIKDLSESKNEIHEKEQEIQALQKRLKVQETNSKVLELLEQSAKDRQMENERLRNLNEELKKCLAEKDLEMESFRKNREATVSSYEALVKSQQEELEREKREVMRFQELFTRQTPSSVKKDENKKLKEKIEDLEDKIKYYRTLDNSKNKTSNSEIGASEDENVPTERSRRARKKILSPITNNDDVQIVELSGSESKSKTRSTRFLPPPEAEQISEKRVTRRKKLYKTSDESFHELEPLDNTESPSPRIGSRTLRSRRK